SPLNDACNEGVLLATVIHHGPDAGVYFPVYDGNGNVMGYVRGADGLLVAQYEYGPFGELLRATGPLSQTFNPLFSTKYLDWETGLYYYGHRYYNPTTGRWLSRDPIGEMGGMNCYLFLGNEPIGGNDYLGLWDTRIHLHATQRWATQVGYPSEAALAVATADEAVDSEQSYITEPGTPYHFDRSLSMGGSEDTRDTMYKKHLKNAQDACNMSLGNDDPKKAAKELGTALHPAQDWVAHADHNKRRLGSFNNLSDRHNNSSPVKGAWKFPDDPDLDVKGSADGRATLSVLHFVYERNYEVGGYVRRDWADYEPGHKRFKLTMDRTKASMTGYRDFVKANGGCNCKKYFGVE
ncbi:MAG: RHS repeat-associated core domain-containing protein, partial [Verrucomicrobiae bacterium]|nr:RHS repeat-associated core domain-containing protein [Verrucomicrobiae bacterium]